jgi:hypothetical protein
METLKKGNRLVDLNIDDEIILKYVSEKLFGRV